MDSLPSDLVVHILSYLSGEDVARFKRLSSNLKESITSFQSCLKLPVMKASIYNINQLPLSYSICISALTEAVENTRCRIQSVRVSPSDKFCDLLNVIANSTKRTPDYPLLLVYCYGYTGHAWKSIEPIYNIFPKFARTTLEYYSEKTTEIILNIVRGWKAASFPEINFGFGLCAEEGEESFRNRLDYFYRDTDRDFYVMKHNSGFLLNTDSEGIPAWIRFADKETGKTVRFEKTKGEIQGNANNYAFVSIVTE